MCFLDTDLLPALAVLFLRISGICFQKACTWDVDVIFDSEIQDVLFSF